jgi:DNA-binding CsgD family transcriptional regulator
MTRIDAESALSRLSDKHLQVLAMVARHRVAKEIAWELGISEDTVAQRMKRVQALLGVSNRADAARVYLQAQQGPGVSGLSVYDTVGLADRPSSKEMKVSPDTGAGLGDRADTLHQPQAAYAAGFIGWPTTKPWYAQLLETRAQNTLSTTARTFVIGSMTLIAILSVAAAVALAEGLSRVF